MGRWVRYIPIEGLIGTVIGRWAMTTQYERQRDLARDFGRTPLEATDIEQVYALSPRLIGPACGHMPSPLVRLVHPAGICPLPSSDWSLLWRRAGAAQSGHRLGGGEEAEREGERGEG
eukprot:1179037-Prorocentrum_minimum.AAC.1